MNYKRSGICFCGDYKGWPKELKKDWGRITDYIHYGVGYKEIEKESHRKSLKISNYVSK